jgi:cell volume regulation protein A
VPLWRLIAGELAWGLRQALHPVKLGVALIVTAVVVAALGPLTPGLVLTQGWRLAVAAGLGVAAAALAHTLLSRGASGQADERRLAVRRLLGAVALLLSGTVVLAYLLASVTGSTDPAAQEALDAALRVDGPLLVGAALLMAGVLAAALGARLRIPGSLLFLAIGMLIGDDGLDWVSLSDPELVQSLGVVALVVILFEGGLTTDVRQLRRGAAPGLALATVGVAVTAGVTALGAVWLLDLPSRVAWLVGAIVASTDAAAVFDLLRRAPLPERLAAVLKVESGANDPVAVLLTVGLLSAWGPPATTTAWIAFGALQLVGGAALGGAGGWLAAVVLRRVELGAAGLYPVLALAAAGVTYGLAVAVGASGFLAVYVAGIVLAADVPRRRAALRTFHTALATGTEVGLFLLLGLLVFPSQLPSVALTALGVAVLLILVGRPLACAVTLAPMGFSARGIGVVAWLGMRGAVPIVLATFAASAAVPEADLIFDVVFFVVLTSALVQGLTAVPVITASGLTAERGAADVVAAAMPLEGTGLDVVEVVVPEGSPLAGSLLRDVPAPDGSLVAAVVRDDDVVIPRGGTRIRPGDLLVVTTVDRDAGIADLSDWARSGRADAVKGAVRTPPGW